MKEALRSSETSVMPHGVTSQKTTFFKFYGYLTWNDGRHGEEARTWNEMRNIPTLG
jgi:hypothetical protein